jgi:hypothetical protein
MTSKKRRSRGPAAQLSELSMLVPEVIARRSMRVAQLGLWSTRRGRSEMNRMVSEKAIASSQSAFAMWMEMVAASQRAWIDASWSMWFPTGHGKALSQKRFDTGARVFAKGLAPLLRKTSDNAKRLRRSRSG